MVVKWGICCVGNISNDFVSAFTEYKDPSNEITAVAASSEEKAKVFAEKFNIKMYFGNYEKLALYDNVDIVYVASVHPHHYHLAKLFLNHNKHVLVELPMTMSAADTQDLIRLAREKKLFLMEGIWSLSFPLYRRMKELIQEGVIGTPKHINANFQADSHYVPRLFKKDQGGGGLYEFAGFIIQFALTMFNGKRLLDASGNLKWENDIDLYGTITLKFENDTTAFLTYHMLVNGDTSAAVYGDSGQIIIPDHFWCPDEMIVNGKLDRSFKLERKDLSIDYYFPYSWYLTHEIQHVSQCIQKGLTESSNHPLEDSLKLAEIVDKLLKH